MDEIIVGVKAIDVKGKFIGVMMTLKGKMFISITSCWG